MESFISTPIITTFFLYISIMIIVGFIAYLLTKTFDDYILGGRRLGRFVTGLSAGASDMSGWLIMGLPAAIFLSGLSEAWMAIGLTIGAWLNWRLVAAPLRVHTELNQNALTLPDYLSNRFEDKSRLIRVISALVILIFFTIYCASGVVAGAKLFQTTFGLSYNTALIAGALATLLYTFIGGFLAVSWTDTIQASLMIFALILTPILIIFTLGGFDEAITLINNADPRHSSWIPAGSSIAIISALGWGLGYCGQPHILARFMASSSHKNLAASRRISISWMFLCLTGAVAVGYFGYAYFLKYPQYAASTLQSPENIFMNLSVLLFNPWIAGILLSAVLAAVMSTLSCQLLVCSSALTEDLYRTFLRPQASQKELVIIGRMMVLLVAVIALLLAINPENSVLGLVSYAWAGFGAAFGPIIVMSLFWPRMTRNGALAGMVVGAATVLIWKHFSFFGLYEIIPGFILALIAIVIFSLLDKQPSKAMLIKFDEAHKILKD